MPRMLLAILLACVLGVRTGKCGDLAGSDGPTTVGDLLQFSGPCNGRPCSHKDLGHLAQQRGQLDGAPPPASDPQIQTFTSIKDLAGADAPSDQGSDGANGPRPAVKGGDEPSSKHETSGASTRRLADSNSGESSSFCGATGCQGQAVFEAQPGDGQGTSAGLQPAKVQDGDGFGSQGDGGTGGQGNGQGNSGGDGGTGAQGNSGGNGGGSGSGGTHHKGGRKGHHKGHRQGHQGGHQPGNQSGDNGADPGGDTNIGGGDDGNGGGGNSGSGGESGGNADPSGTNAGGGEAEPGQQGGETGGSNGQGGGNGGSGGQGGADGGPAGTSADAGSALPIGGEMEQGVQVGPQPGSGGEAEVGTASASTGGAAPGNAGGQQDGTQGEQGGAGAGAGSNNAADGDGTPGGPGGAAPGDAAGGKGKGKKQKHASGYGNGHQENGGPAGKGYVGGPAGEIKPGGQGGNGTREQDGATGGPAAPGGDGEDTPGQGGDQQGGDTQGSQAGTESAPAGESSATSSGGNGYINSPAQDSSSAAATGSGNRAQAGADAGDKPEGTPDDDSGNEDGQDREKEDEDEKEPEDPPPPPPQSPPPQPPPAVSGLTHDEDDVRVDDRGNDSDNPVHSNKRAGLILGGLAVCILALISAAAVASTLYGKRRKNAAQYAFPTEDSDAVSGSKALGSSQGLLLPPMQIRNAGVAPSEHPPRPWPIEAAGLKHFPPVEALPPKASTFKEPAVAVDFSPLEHPSTHEVLFSPAASRSPTVKNARIVDTPPTPSAAESHQSNSQAMSWYVNMLSMSPRDSEAGTPQASPAQDAGGSGSQTRIKSMTEAAEMVRGDSGWDDTDTCSLTMPIPSAAEPLSHPQKPVPVETPYTYTPPASNGHTARPQPTRKESLDTLSLPGTPSLPYPMHESETLPLPGSNESTKLLQNKNEESTLSLPESMASSPRSEAELVSLPAAAGSEKRHLVIPRTRQPAVAQPTAKGHRRSRLPLKPLQPIHSDVGSDGPMVSHYTSPASTGSLSVTGVVTPAIHEDGGSRVGAAAPRQFIVPVGTVPEEPESPESCSSVGDSGGFSAALPPGISQPPRQFFHDPLHLAWEAGGRMCSLTDNEDTEANMLNSYTSVDVTGGLSTAFTQDSSRMAQDGSRMDNQRPRKFLHAPLQPVEGPRVSPVTPADEPDSPVSDSSAGTAGVASTAPVLDGSVIRAAPRHQASGGRSPALVKAASDASNPVAADAGEPDAAPVGTGRGGPGIMDSLLVEDGSRALPSLLPSAHGHSSNAPSTRHPKTRSGGMATGATQTQPRAPAPANEPNPMGCSAAMSSVTAEDGSRAFVAPVHEAACGPLQRRSKNPPQKLSKLSARRVSALSMLEEDSQNPVGPVIEEEDDLQASNIVSALLAEDGSRAVVQHSQATPGVSYADERRAQQQRSKGGRSKRASHAQHIQNTNKVSGSGMPGQAHADALGGTGVVSTGIVSTALAEDGSHAVLPVLQQRTRPQNPVDELPSRRHKRLKDLSKMMSGTHCVASKVRGLGGGTGQLGSETGDSGSVSGVGTTTGGLTPTGATAGAPDGALTPLTPTSPLADTGALNSEDTAGLQLGSVQGSAGSAPIVVIAALEQQLDRLQEVADGVLLNSYRLDGKGARRRCTHSLVAYATECAPPKRRCTIKFFFSQDAFEHERALVLNEELESALPTCLGVVHEIHKRRSDVVGLLPPMLVMERGECLTDSIARCTMGDVSAHQVIVQLASKLKVLHDHGYAHRDLKPETCVWLQSRKSWALMGLESCSKIGKLEQLAMNVFYAAPESVRAFLSGEDRLQVSAAADVFSLGVLSVELLLRLPFYPSNITGEQVGRMLSGDEQLPHEQESTQTALGEVKRLVNQMLHRDPAQRAGIDDVLGWYQGKRDF